MIIRPLCEVREGEVSRLATRLRLPAFPNRCPNVHANRRELMKEIMKMVSHVDRHAVSNVYGSAWRINREYLPDPDEKAETLPDDEP